jgi:hypothetical protein
MPAVAQDPFPPPTPAAPTENATPLPPTNPPATKPKFEYRTDYLYLKNNSSSDVFVWVNGEEQGMVGSGVSAMMPREGFATNDSGVQPNGAVVAKHSFGGWEKKDVLEVKAAGWSNVRNAEGKMERVLIVWEIPAVGLASKGESWVWIGGEPKMTQEDVERAGKFQPGRPPAGMVEMLPKATGFPPPDANIGGAAFASAFPSSPISARWSSSAKKPEPKIAKPPAVVGKKADPAPPRQTLAGSWSSKKSILLGGIAPVGKFRYTFVFKANETVFIRAWDDEYNIYEGNGTYFIEGKEIKMKAQFTTIPNNQLWRGQAAKKFDASLNLSYLLAPTLFSRNH